MNLITIKTPIWNGRKVGLAEDKLGKYTTEVKITYKTKDGELLYPNSYVITTKDIKAFPVELVKGVRLRIVPIENMDVMYTLRRKK